MRTIPFLFTAAWAIVCSFVALNPFHTVITVTTLLVTAAVLLAVSYAERPYAWRPPEQEDSPQLRRKQWKIISVCAALTVSVLVTHWPLRTSFFLSRSALESIASQAASGVKISLPQTAGMFDVESVYLEKGRVFLWIDEDAANTGEPVGFMRGEPDKANYPEAIPVCAGWFLVYSI